MEERPTSTESRPMKGVQKLPDSFCHAPAPSEDLGPGRGPESWFGEEVAKMRICCSQKKIKACVLKTKRHPFPQIFLFREHTPFIGSE